MQRRKIRDCPAYLVTGTRLALVGGKARLISLLGARWLPDVRTRFYVTQFAVRTLQKTARRASPRERKREKRKNEGGRENEMWAVAPEDCSTANLLDGGKRFVARKEKRNGKGCVVKEKWKINALGATRRTAELAMLLTFPINLFTVSLFRFHFLLSPSYSFLVYLLFRDTAKVSSRSSRRFRLLLCASSPVSFAFPSLSSHPSTCDVFSISKPCRRVCSPFPHIYFLTICFHRFFLHGLSLYWPSSAQVLSFSRAGTASSESRSVHTVVSLRF